MSILHKIFSFRSKDTVQQVSGNRDLQEILAKVRKIEIKSKGLTNHIFGGEYHSAFKGRGMSFSEVREYTHGDDVRSIDWNVTARFNNPYIKVFEEERELTLMLLIDISSSSLFGTHEHLKRDVITEIAAILSFSAVQNNDKVGAIFFSNRIEKYIAPKKGKSHMLYIIRELLSVQAKSHQNTQIQVALQFLNSIQKKKSIAFILSDFYSEPYQSGIQIAGKKHDLIGVHIYDRMDKELPQVGPILLEDHETHEQKLVQSNDRYTQQQYTAQFLAHEKLTQDILKRNGCEYLGIQSDKDYVKQLQIFFKSRK